jgi:phage shock protein PspC (stress-responsive transcriptional regulator)
MRQRGYSRRIDAMETTPQPPTPEPTPGAPVAPHQAGEPETTAFHGATDEAPGSESPPSGDPAAEHAAPPASAAAGERPRLARTRDGKIAGVASGLARATGTDPILFRVLLLVLIFFGGVGALLYALGWLLLPADGDEASPIGALLGPGTSSTRPVTTVVLGAVALVLAAIVLNFSVSALLLLAGVGLGLALLLRRPPLPH